MREEILRMERVTYQEQGMTQLENFSMTIWAGEIMGLVPVNHTGLAALIRLLRQNLALHYGYVYYREHLVNQWRHSDMSTNRISVIQSQSCLAEGLTVADNIFVLRPGFRKSIMNPRLLEAQLKPFLEDIGMEISANAYVESLSAFERFVVELLKAVVAGYHLVVLRDVGTFLSARELVKLHDIMRHYAAHGTSFLYIAAHYEEVEGICDRTALMMNGQIIKYFKSSDQIPDMFFLQCTEDFERYVKKQMSIKPELPASAPVVFETVDLCCGSMEHLNIAVRAGECLVMQDLDNCVCQEMLEILSGNQVQEQGEIRIRNQRFSDCDDRRIAIIQELPIHTMLFENLSYMDNLCFTMDHHLSGVWSSNRIKNSIRCEYAVRLGEEVFDLPVDQLTQVQKYDLIYTRILLQNPKVVFCVQPFKSAEVSLRIHIMELLEMLLERGIAVVILAVNLADSLALADRLIRIRHGGEMQEYQRSDFGKLTENTPWLYLYQKNQY